MTDIREMQIIMCLRYERNQGDIESIGYFFSVFLCPDHFVRMPFNFTCLHVYIVFKILSFYLSGTCFHVLFEVDRNTYTIRDYLNIEIWEHDICVECGLQAPSVPKWLSKPATAAKRPGFVSKCSAGLHVSLDENMIFNKLV